MAVLVFGYQVILLSVAFLLGQDSFFWRFKKNFLRRIGLLKTKKTTSPES